MREEMKKLIALNCAQKPNRGLAFVNDLQMYDRLTHESWLAKMVDDIRSGNDALKDELPIRCSHYYRFSDNRRRQADMDPEAFLFQTCVDIDDPEAVELPSLARTFLIKMRAASGKTCCSTWSIQPVRSSTSISACLWA